MTGLLMLFMVFFCWLGYTLYTAAREAMTEEFAAEGVVCVLMGDQAGVAEWFLRSLCRNEAIQSGRLAVAVAAEGTADDTAGIARILSREKGFYLMEPDEWPPTPVTLDVRSINNMYLLKSRLQHLILHSLSGQKSEVRSQKSEWEKPE